MNLPPKRLPKQQPAEAPSEYTRQRLERKRQNYRMTDYRSIPTDRRAWHVTTTVFEIPQWFLDELAMPSLPCSPQSFWIRHRGFAQRIVKLDRAAGGEGNLECVQFRLCRVCKRPLVGARAHEYAEKIRLPKFRWEFPRGPSCGVECARKNGGKS